MTAFWHLREALDIDTALRPFAGELRFSGEQGNSSGDFTALWAALLPVTGSSILEIHPCRQTRRLRRLINRQVGE